MKVVNDAITVKNKELIEKQAEGKEKCARIEKECYGKKKLFVCTLHPRGVSTNRLQEGSSFGFKTLKPI